LTESAQEWQRLGRDEGLLYRGARLAEAIEWRHRQELALNELERAFLDASAALRARERRAAQQRVQFTIGGLIVGLAVISILALVSLAQRDMALNEAGARAVAEGRALSERDAAEQARAVSFSRELAASALAQLPVDPELGVLLASEAVRV